MLPDATRQGAHVYGADAVKKKSDTLPSLLSKL